MEPRVWIFLVLVLIVSAAQALIIADLYYAKKRVARLEYLLGELCLQHHDLSKCADDATQQRYGARRAARKLIGEIKEDD